MNRILHAVGLMAAALLISQASAATAAAADPTGNWKWMFTTPNNGDIEFNLSLKAEGEKLTGKVTRNDQTTEISDGTFKNEEVAFKVVRERNGQTITVKYSGKLEGDSIKGKVEFDFGGESRTFDWNPTRVK